MTNEQILAAAEQIKTQQTRADHEHFARTVEFQRKAVQAARPVKRTIDGEAAEIAYASGIALLGPVVQRVIDLERLVEELAPRVTDHAIALFDQHAMLQRITALEAQVTDLAVALYKQRAPDLTSHSAVNR